MFKKGQLVKTKDYSYYGVIEQISNKVNGMCYIRTPNQRFGKWCFEDGLTLIGNNFKFKGAK